VPVEFVEVVQRDGQKWKRSGLSARSSYMVQWVTCLLLGIGQLAHSDRSVDVWRDEYRSLLEQFHKFNRGRLELVLIVQTENLFSAIPEWMRVE
jgi:hypothetical protein